MKSKTSLTVLILCLLFSITGMAQTQDTVYTTQTTISTQDNNDNDHDNTPKSRVGIRAGVNISKQQFDQGDLDVNPDSKFGLDLALVMDFPVAEGFAIFVPFSFSDAMDI